MYRTIMWRHDDERRADIMCAFAGEGLGVITQTHIIAQGPPPDAWGLGGLTYMMGASKGRKVSVKSKAKLIKFLCSVLKLDWVDTEAPRLQCQACIR